MARHFTTFHDPFRPVSILCRTQIARENGVHPQARARHWRVWVRPKGKSLTETFVNRDDTKNWGFEAERQIGRGGSPLPSRVGRIAKFKELIDLHIADMTKVGKPLGRSRAATLDMLKRELGEKSIFALAFRDP